MSQYSHTPHVLGHSLATILPLCKWLSSSSLDHCFSMSFSEIHFSSLLASCSPLTSLVTWRNLGHSFFKSHMRLDFPLVTLSASLYSFFSSGVALFFRCVWCFDHNLFFSSGDNRSLSTSAASSTVSSSLAKAILSFKLISPNFSRFLALSFDFSDAFAFFSKAAGDLTFFGLSLHSDFSLLSLPFFAKAPILVPRLFAFFSKALVWQWSFCKTSFLQQPSCKVSL